MTVIHRWRVTIAKFDQRSKSEIANEYRCRKKSFDEIDRVLRDGVGQRIHYMDTEPSHSDIYNMITQYSKDCPPGAYKWIATKEEIWESVTEKFVPA